MASIMFAIANTWDTLEDTERQALKELVSGLVRYPCKLACKPNNGSVDIYVFSVKKNKVTDWIEMQPSGAVGVLFDMYQNPDSSSVNNLDVACELYNESNGLTYEDSGSESSESSDSSDESTSDD